MTDKPKTRNKLIAWGLPLLGLCGVIFTFIHPQSPGFSIGLLALAAGIMSVRSNMPMPEKLAWVGLLIAFTVLEVRAINHNDKINEGIRDDQNEKFQQIADELADNVGNITGGDSYAYIDVGITPTPPFELAFEVKGKKYPVRNLVATIQVGKTQQLLPVGTGTLPLGRYRIVDKVIGPGRYIFTIETLNGHITELLDIAKCSDGHWNQAISLSGAGKKDNDKLKGREGCHKPF